MTGLMDVADKIPPMTFHTAAISIQVLRGKYTLRYLLARPPTRPPIGYAATV